MVNELGLKRRSIPMDARGFMFLLISWVLMFDSGAITDNLKRFKKQL